MSNSSELYKTVPLPRQTSHSISIDGVIENVVPKPLHSEHVFLGVLFSLFILKIDNLVLKNTLFFLHQVFSEALQ